MVHTVISDCHDGHGSADFPDLHAALDDHIAGCFELPHGRESVVFYENRKVILTLVPTDTSILLIDPAGKITTIER
jgi:hypothetical protein